MLSLFISSRSFSRHALDRFRMLNGDSEMVELPLITKMGVAGKALLNCCALDKTHNSLNPPKRVIFSGLISFSAKALFNCSESGRCWSNVIIRGFRLTLEIMTESSLGEKNHPL